MAAFYANENFPFGVVQQLRMLGHDVVTVAEAGNSGQRIPDQQVLEYAIAHHRAVLTINRRDFIRLHLSSTQHTGIVVCTQDADTAGQAQRIDEAVRDEPSLAGQLIRVNRPGQPTNAS
jgi:hypothetical protein